MIVNPEIESYIYGLLPPRDALLAEMEQQAERRGIPIVGPAAANLLAQLVRLSGARRIFELGSAIGYSTIWLARAAGPNAEVHYTDSSPANAEEARGYFERAGLTARIHIHVGDALGSLASVPGQFDVIFNDIDKTGYPAVLDAVPARLKTGGLLVADNVLRRGEVTNPTDASARAVVEFNRKLFSSNDFWSSIVPLRDGLSISLRA
jgi:predicted O-methyltransferase YrrM